MPQGPGNPRDYDLESPEAAAGADRGDDYGTLESGDLTDAELARDRRGSMGAAAAHSGRMRRLATAATARPTSSSSTGWRGRAARRRDPSEESADDPARLSARRVWIVDPLDGTREFTERREDSAVHVALAIDGLWAGSGRGRLPRLGCTFPAIARPLCLKANCRPAC